MEIFNLLNGTKVHLDHILLFVGYNLFSNCISVDIRVSFIINSKLMLQISIDRLQKLMYFWRISMYRDL